MSDEAECAASDVSLERLAPDLQAAKRTPALSYIVPDACHAGGELPCEEGKPAGPLAAEEFLKRLAPAIEASPAYKEGGLIAITSAEARQTGPTPDVSSCCILSGLPEHPGRSHAAGSRRRPGQAERAAAASAPLLLSAFVAPARSTKFPTPPTTRC